VLRVAAVNIGAYLPTIGRPQPSPSTDHPIISIFHTRPQLPDALKAGILLQGVQEGCLPLLLRVLTAVSHIHVTVWCVTVLILLVRANRGQTLQNGVQNFFNCFRVSREYLPTIPRAAAAET